MDKVEVRTRALSQALFSLATAGCETVEVSTVDHAVKLGGIKQDKTLLTLHVWSTEAEDTEKSIGKGERQLTADELVFLDKGHCPLCEEHGKLYRGPRGGLAINVACEAGHTFWVPPLPWVPEYLGQTLGADEVIEGLKEEEEEEIIELLAPE